MPSESKFITSILGKWIVDIAIKVKLLDIYVVPLPHDEFQVPLSKIC